MRSSRWHNWDFKRSCLKKNCYGMQPRAASYQCFPSRQQRSLRPSFSKEDVLYMDNQMLCVNKPAGLLSQADRTGDTDVLELAREYVRLATNKPGDAFVALVHRLDRPVSGVMSVARTSKAAARLSASFRTRHGVEKIYHAVVAGKLTGSGTREDFLVSRGGSGALERTDGRGPRTVIYRSMPPPIETRAVMPKGSGYGDEFSTADEGNTSPQPDRCQARPPEAKRAVLEWAAIDLPSPGARIPRCPRSGSPLTLVRVRLVTGRKHQIRVQLAGMGCPVVGDVRYGRFRGEGGTYAGSVPLEDRSILLHASGLVIPHPTRPGETVRVVAPPPKAWINLCGKEIIDVVLADARR